MGQSHLTNRTKCIPACLDLDADLTWSRDVFYRSRGETTRTSCKPLIDKPCHTTKSLGDTNRTEEVYRTATRLAVSIADCCLPSHS